MKRFVLSLILLAVMSVPAVAQESIPDKVEKTAVESSYFAGATAADKAFVDSALKAIDKSALRPGQKRRAKRLMKKRHFAKRIQSRYMEEMYWDDPSTFHEVEGKTVPRQAIDWGSVDWAAIITIILELLSKFLI